MFWGVGTEASGMKGRRIAMKVFVSYCYEDSAIAKEVIARLAAKGLKVWSDDQVLLGENWALAVGKALEEADAIVVLLSPDALNSESVRREIGYAMTQQRFHGRFIPVRVRPTRVLNWMLVGGPLIDWRSDPERAADHIAKALRRAAGPAAKRKRGASARARPVPEPAGVTT